MHPGRADLAINGIASDHDAQADRLESFSRPLVIAAHYQQTVPHPDDIHFRQYLAQWFREALVIGSNPDHPDYW